MCARSTGTGSRRWANKDTAKFNMGQAVEDAYDNMDNILPENASRTVQLMRFVFAFPTVSYVGTALYVMRYPLVKARMAEIRQQLDMRRTARATDQNRFRKSN